jgi:HlyD family secretion protein
VGDSVTEGQVLARLDLTKWQQNITDLESALATKEQALTQTQQSLTSAKRTVTARQNAVTTAERAVDTAKYNLTKAERSVEQTNLNIASAELSLKKAQYNYDLGLSTSPWVEEELAMQKQQLEFTKASLADAERDVETAKYNITTAETAVENAKLDVADAEVDVTLKEANVVKAEKDVADAQSALDEAKATNPEITAPFDGLIIAINTKAGSEVYKGGAVVTIVDPDQFEAIVSVGETDISNVKVDGDATIEFDAISGLVLPGKVTSISPTAVSSQGVVSYTVTVEVDSSMLNRQAGGGQGPAQAAGTGQQSTQPSDMTPPEGFTPGQMPSGGTMPEGFTPGQMPSGMSAAMNPQSVTLREGFTATVNIIISEAVNVIYVPTQAIGISNNNDVVNVISNDVITERVVKVGMTTSKYAEITEGLDEGEQVVYTRTITTGATTTAAQQQQGMFQMGGDMGGGPAMGGGGMR